jgi:ribosomal protein L37AE/L43A
MIQPKDEYVCDNCHEMQADYGAPGLDGTTVWICSACQEEGTYENVEFEGDYE